MKMRRVPLFAGLIAMAACGSSSAPTEPTAVQSDARQDGGLVLGSGNRSDSTRTGEASAQDDGGLVLGSGN
jgi:hypothetical protein